MASAADMILEGPRPIRRVEYEQMVELGLFEGDRIELLYGVIVTMSPHGPDHDDAVERLNARLVRALFPGAKVRIQSAFAASDGSEPEPDVAVVPPLDYRHAHPSQAWLIVEVARASLSRDRGPKAKLYAESGVNEYWVVNLVDKLIMVHTDIVSGSYARILSYRCGECIRLGYFPDITVAVDEVLG